MRAVIYRVKDIKSRQGTSKEYLRFEVRHYVNGQRRCSSFANLDKAKLFALDFILGKAKTRSSEVIDIV